MSNWDGMIAPPPDSTWLSDWMGGIRFFFGTQRKAGGLDIVIAAMQDDTGRVVGLGFEEDGCRMISVGNDPMLPARQVRASALAFADNPLADTATQEVAAAMLEACAEIDALER
jgi:hypothetical protein